MEKFFFPVSHNFAFLKRVEENFDCGNVALGSWVEINALKIFTPIP